MPLTLAKTLHQPQSKVFPAKWILGVAAGKGGVGKSTLSALLAQSFHSMGLRVGVLDADLYGPSQRLLLREDIPPVKTAQFFRPARSRGIQLISMAHFKKDQEACAFRAPIANQLITQFLEQIQWDPMDLLLVDFPPGTGDVVLTLGQKLSLDGALIVSTAGSLAISDVNRCIDLFEQMQVPIIGFAENMSYIETSGGPIYPFGRGNVEALAYSRGYPLLASLPLESQLGESFEKKESFIVSKPQHVLSKEVVSLSQKTLEVFENSQKALTFLDYAWKEWR